MPQKEQEGHLDTTFLALIILNAIHTEEIRQGQTERLKSHLPDCAECGRRLVRLLRSAEGETRISVLGLDVVLEIRDVFAECLRQYG